MVTAKRRILSVVICAAMFMTCFAVMGMSQRVYAASALDDLSGTWEMTYYPSKKSYNYYDIENMKNVTIDMATVKISKPEVVDFIKKKWDSEGDTYYTVRVKKAGKATITFKAKEPNAGDGTYVAKKITINSIKYLNVVKTFKIGKKSIAKKFASRDYYTKMGLFNGTKTLSKQKISIKVKSGWKIRRIELQHFTPVTDEDGEHLMYDEKGSRTIKNNTKVDILPHSSLFIEVYNKKTKTSIYALVE